MKFDRSKAIVIDNPEEIVDSNKYYYYFQLTYDRSNIEQVNTRFFLKNSKVIQYLFSNRVGGPNIIVYKIPKNNKIVKKII